MITVHLRYEIDPDKLEDVTDEAFALFAFPSLAEDEAYRIQKPLFAESSVSRDRDTAATAPRHPSSTVEDMTAPRLIPTLASLGFAALLLAGCSVAVVDPAATGSTPSTSPSTSDASDASDAADAADGGSGVTGFTSGQDCADRDIVISDEEVTALLTGNCASVTVEASAIGASVNIFSTDRLTVAADSVMVVADSAVGAAEWSGTGGTLTSPQVASVSITGDENAIIVKNIDDVAVAGTANTITWDAGDQTADDTGSGNVLLGPN